MRFEATEIGGRKACRLAEKGVVIATAQDALALVAESGCDRVILARENLHPEFFELRTGLAGEVLQKLVIYGVRVAVVGDFRHVGSRSLRALIHESNRTGQFVFVGSEAEIAGLWR